MAVWVLNVSMEQNNATMECSCGEEFATWGKATRHAEEEH